MAVAAGPLAAAALVVVDSALGTPIPVLPLAALALLLATWRLSRRSLLALALLAVAADAAGFLHRRLESQASRERGEAAISSRMHEVELRMQALVSTVEMAARQAAALPETAAALEGDAATRSRLFLKLDSLRQRDPRRPALAIHALPLSTIAWSGRVVDFQIFQGVLGQRNDVLLLAGSVSTTLVGVAPVMGPSGSLLGLATAEIPIAARRNIRNDYLSDFDAVTLNNPSVAIHYVDARDEAEGPPPFTPPPAGAPMSRDAVLRAPDGSVLAAARVTALEPDAKAWPAPYRGLVAGLACLLLLAWAPLAWRRWRLLGLAVVASLLRGVLLLLTVSLPAGLSPLLSPDTYASTLLGPLLRSPVDLLATTVWGFVLASVLLAWVLERWAPLPSAWRALVADVAALPLLAGTFAWMADTLANCALDVEAISPLPRSAAHFVLQWSLLLVLATGAALLVALFAWGGAFEPTLRGRLGRALQWTVLGLLAFRFWPREWLGLPVVPALALFLLPAIVGGMRAAWQARWRAAAPGTRAGLVLLTVAVLGGLLYPSLAHFSEKSTRIQIERELAPHVLRQPEWREYVLTETRRKIDALNVLEDSPPGPQTPLLEEMAFAVWSSTDLATFGFSSAIEIQDASGLIISRFALNLPSFAGPPRPLPDSDAWEVRGERLSLASAERRVLHAQKRLSYHGLVHGAVHIYVGDDFWNLPFVTAKDPYSILFRTTARGTSRDRPIELFAYDWSLAPMFSSAERPPQVDAALAARLRGGPFWTTLPLDDGAQHTYLFSDAHGIYGLGYPRLGAGRYAADLIEAVSGVTLSALIGLLLLMLARTLLGRTSLSLSSLARTVRQRFALRLSVTFIAVAVLPVAVLEFVVRGFVADRLERESVDQALGRAAVAKKAVEDFAFFQRGEAPGRQPVTDAALVWVASLVRNDLDVFERGRLLASSKRELYASGLLPPRLSGNVFRALALDGQASALSTEEIGGFSYRVVSVPVRLEAPEPGILSIPLALRQREVQAVLNDLDRVIRLASVFFLMAAALLAHSMARRISGPLRDLTRATQRVAGGDLDTRVTTPSRDEFLALVESFNKMAGDLDRQRRELERSNRLAAWAEMARQVAHEVKNPLTPIQLSAEHLQRVYGDPDVDFRETLRACTETILRQVRHLREIVTEFSAFARPPEPVRELQHLPRLLEEVVKPYIGVLPPHVSLTLVSPGSVPPVFGERRLLERAVVNLLENALQAVGDKGTVLLRLRSHDERVEIEVEDSGPGVDPELRDRIFQPFFSTKTGGSGLGLALVKKIAEDHGGGVSLEGEPGRTRAILWLPAASPSSALASEGSEA